MATNISATVRHEAPHVNQTTRTGTIINALKRRAQAVLKDTSIDPQNRAIIRYALEITIHGWLNSSAARMRANPSSTTSISRKHRTRASTIRATKKSKHSRR